MTRPDDQLNASSSSTLAAALLITWQSALYRLRRREANNVLTTASLMVAFHLPWLDVAYRSLYAVVLNIFIYLLNDYYDIEVDLASSTKDQAKAHYMAENRTAAQLALFGLGALLLAGAAVHSWLLVAAFAVNAIIVLVYSAWLKRLPLVDLLMMGLWGITMALVGLPAADNLHGWQLIILLGLLCSSFEIIQVVRDEPEDREAGLVTTAVYLGVKRSVLAFRLVVLLSALYGVLALKSPIPAALALAVLLPLNPQRASRTWDLSRVLFGVVWLGLLAQVYLGLLGT